jgi:ribokinase
MTSEVIVLGSMNLDIFVQLEKLPGPGETKSASKMFKAPGGKSSNQAVAIAKSGLKPVLIAAVGDDADGGYLISHAASQGVDVSHVLKLPNVSSGTAFVMVDDFAENLIVVVPGANAELDVKHASACLSNVKDSYKAMVAALEIDPGVIREAFRSSRQKSAVTFLNPSPFSSAALSLIEYSDFVVVNEGESSALASELHVSLDDLPNALAARNVQHLIITRGADGCVHHSLKSTGLSMRSYAAPAIHPVDTTGCGDAFLGSLVSDFVVSGDVDMAIKFALKAASFAALSQGAQTSYGIRQDIELAFSSHSFF